MLEINCEGHGGQIKGISWLQQKDGTQRDKAMYAPLTLNLTQGQCSLPREQEKTIDIPKGSFKEVWVNCVYCVCVCMYIHMHIYLTPKL